MELKRKIECVEEDWLEILFEPNKIQKNEIIDISDEPIDDEIVMILNKKEELPKINLMPKKFEKIEKIPLYNLKFCVSSNIGKRLYQQDTYITIPITEFLDSNGKKRKGSLFVIFDGHGGSQVSDFLRDEFAEYFENTPLTDNNIKEIFMEIDQQFDDAKNVGSTCVAVFILETGLNQLEVICANSGDSRAVMLANSWYFNISFYIGIFISFLHI